MHTYVFEMNSFHSLLNIILPHKFALEVIKAKKLLSSVPGGLPLQAVPPSLPERGRD